MEPNRQSDKIAEKPLKKRLFLIMAAVCLASAAIFRMFFVQPYKIASPGMEDTISSGSCILATKNCRNDQPRGGLIVFSYPEDPDKLILMRIIGLPGEMIQGIDKKVYVNGRLYAPPFEVHKEKDIIPQKQNPRDTFGPVRIPPGSYFVMGDNRDHSYDSRFWGVLPKDKIRGHFLFKLW